MIIWWPDPGFAEHTPQEFRTNLLHSIPRCLKMVIRAEDANTLQYNCHLIESCEVVSKSLVLQISTYDNEFYKETCSTRTSLKFLDMISNPKTWISLCLKDFKYFGTQYKNSKLEVFRLAPGVERDLSSCRSICPHWRLLVNFFASLIIFDGRKNTHGNDKHSSNSVVVHWPVQQG